MAWTGGWGCQGDKDHCASDTMLPETGLPHPKPDISPALPRVSGLRPCPKSSIATQLPHLGLTMGQNTEVP